MKRTIEAIHENGLLRPLEPLGLAEHQAVRITLESINGEHEEEWLDQGAIEMAKGSSAKALSLDEIRKITSRDPSSWAETILSERGDY